MVKHTGFIESHLDWIYKISGAAALLLAFIFLLAMKSLFAASLQLGSMFGWLSLFENNWLVVLFKFNAGLDGVQFDLLNRLNFLDIAILALVAVMYLGLYATVYKSSKILSIIAAIQPILGIVLFIATRTAGRSAVMGAGIVISLVMLRSTIFGKLIATLGILASVLLLVGDVSTAPNTPSIIIASVIGIGYVLLTIWFFLIAGKFLRSRPRA